MLRSEIWLSNLFEMFQGIFTENIKTNQKIIPWSDTENLEYQSIQR